MIYRESIVVLCMLALMIMGSINDVSAASSVCTDGSANCLQFTVREPYLIYGPTADRNLSCNPQGTVAPIDQPVESIYFSPNDAKVFNSLGCTYVFQGTEIGNAVNINPTSVLMPGPPGSFDSGGAWITAAARCGGGDNVVAWYHAEEPTSNGQVHKSIGVATSTNRGLSFSRLGHQVLNDGSSTTLGIGDHTVVEFGNSTGNYYHIYFINHSQGGFVSLARASTSLCAKTPGDWAQYYNGTWQQALTGPASMIVNRYPWSLSGGHFDPTGDTSLMVASNLNGIELLFSNDGLNFVAAPDRLHPIGKQGIAQTEDKLWYPSMIGQDQENRWANGFWFYYMLTFGPTVDTPTGETVDKARRQVRRWVDVTRYSQPISGPKVKIALSRYYRASNTDHAASIELPEPGYVSEGILGYLATEPYPGMVKVQECWWPNWGGGDHTLSVSCQAEGANWLRDAGYMYSTAQPNTHALYRGFWPNTADHMMTIDPHCEGAPQCGLFGYILN